MIRVTRVLKSERGCFGVVSDGLIPLCVTLENPDTLIPPGLYRAHRVLHHPETPGAYVCYGLDVPGRSNIHFHIANYPRELSGCIAPGRRFFQNCVVAGVLDSREAFNDFMSAYKGDIRFEIVDAY